MIICDPHSLTCNVNKVYMILVIRIYAFGPGYDTYGCDNQSLATVKSVKHYLLKEFLDNLKQLSSILTIIWTLETTYIIRFVT